MAYTLEELDKRYLRQDSSSALLQALQQSVQLAREIREQLAGLTASTNQRFDMVASSFDSIAGSFNQRFDQLDQRMSRLEVDMHEIKEFIGKDKTRH